MNGVPQQRRDQLHVAPRYQPIFRELGIDAEAVFHHPQITPWRSLSDRENCTLDATLDDGQRLRWHIKRYAATTSSDASTPADAEVAGLKLLMYHEIPTSELVAWGKLVDGRSFIILDDLSGYEAADKLVERGLAFAKLLDSTAVLAARLHDAGLHHRDLYLCHMFVKVSDEPDAMKLRLIDAARVRPLPRFLKNRWISKDLAQFWYSTMSLPINQSQREQWLACYAARRSIDAGTLRRTIDRKVRWIARHDARLRRRQPNRNVSIPTSSPSLQPPAGGRSGSGS